MGRYFRLLAIILCLSMSISFVSYAGDPGEEGTWASDESSAADESSATDESKADVSTSELAEQARKELGATPEQVAEYKAAWDALTLAGTASSLSQEAVAGMFGNSWGECNWNTRVTEKGNTGAGFGAYGFTSSSYQHEYQTYSRSCGHNSDLVTLTTTSGTFTICPHIECQTMYVLSKLQTSWDRGSCTRDFAEVCAEFPDTVPQGMQIYNSYEEFKNCDDCKSAASTFLVIYEKSASVNLLMPKYAGKNDELSNRSIGSRRATYGEWFIAGFGNEARPKYAELAFQIFSGTTIKGNKDTATDMAKAMVSAGYWTEEELSEYAKLEEINVDAILEAASREKLTGENLEGLSWWERNVQDDKATGGLVGWIRKLVQFAGILFIVWVIFIYLAYWFDRINNFFYIDLLSLLTIGFLHMSDTEEECNFKLRDLGKGDRRTVNHKAILEICLLGIFFGVFVVTGAYYKVIMWIIQFATQMFSKWF